MIIIRAENLTGIKKWLEDGEKTRARCAEVCLGGMEKRLPVIFFIVLRKASPVGALATIDGNDDDA
jgi:hypothetical protein